jgi:uncharacterized damage-inducible protein DinB
MTEENAKTIADYILSQIEAEAVTTKKVLAAVPTETGAYKPDEKCMTGLALAGHIAAAEVFFLKGVVTGTFEWKPPEFKTSAEAIQYFDRHVPELIAQARALSGEKLLQPISMGPWTQPALEFLSLDLRHGIHHRGQLSAYLRPMGAKVPGIYGPSGDDEKAAAS